MIPIHRLPLPAEVTDRMTTLSGHIRSEDPSHQVQIARDLWRSKTTRSQVATPIRTVLQRMAPGAERCMYCGDSFGTDIDHYEPIAQAPLRTFDWPNHLLACSHCNSHHKRDQFPLDEQGIPLLIDPTVEDPFDHLMLSLSVGEYRALSEKGRRTIEVCGLNRFALARARQNVFQVVVLCLRTWSAAVRGENLYDPAQVLHMIREQPCADVCQAMLRQVEQPGAAVVFSEVPDIVGLLRDRRVREVLLLTL
ncbi:HNH endonuclease [Winogradskya humida]|uniref:HNH endonuclease n=1 Tax=Winogradskya humida TaxID=113566 RepID=A0ABQ4A710_9ACTN|nr:HNH endonuclease [Actinoplanes humidus]GIE26624.1 HNH endonuclease [Actinoplanes humidus]